MGTTSVAASKAIGFVARRAVTLRAPSKFEALLTSVVEAGANHVHGIAFETTELRKHRDRARALAMKAAREKAIALAAELEQKIGRPDSISEGQITFELTDSLDQG